MKENSEKIQNVKDVRMEMPNKRGSILQQSMQG